MCPWHHSISVHSMWMQLEMDFKEQSCMWSIETDGCCRLGCVRESRVKERRTKERGKVVVSETWYMNILKYLIGKGWLDDGVIHWATEWDCCLLGFNITNHLLFLRGGGEGVKTENSQSSSHQKITPCDLLHLQTLQLRAQSSAWLTGHWPWTSNW